MKKVLTVLGAAVAGFAAGVLTAPKSGKETRKDLKKKANELKKDADKCAAKAKTVAKDTAASLKSGAQKVGKATTEAAHDVKGDVEKSLKEFDNNPKTRDNGTDETSCYKSRVFDDCFWCDCRVFGRRESS